MKAFLERIKSVRAFEHPERQLGIRRRLGIQGLHWSRQALRKLAFGSAPPSVLQRTADSLENRIIDLQQSPRGMEPATRELMEIVHFTEDVSAKIHGQLNRGEIFRTVAKEFERSRKYSASILLLNEDGTKLRFVESSLSSEEREKREKVAGVQLKEILIDPDLTGVYRQVIREGKTVQLGVADALSEIFTRPVAFLLTLVLGARENRSILTPLYCQGKVIGVLSISSPAMVEHFIPSVKNLGRHISEALELAEEYSQRKEAEAVLRETEQEWRSLLKNVPSLVLKVDRDGMIQYVNQPAGIASEGLVGSSIYEYLPEGHRQEASRRLERVFKRGKIEAYEIDGIGPDGKLIWLSQVGPLTDHRGRIESAVISTVDITQHRRTEAALLESEERQRIYFENAPDPVFRFDQKGRLIGCNKVVEELLGYEVDELIGRRPSEMKVLPLDQIPRMADSLVRTLRGEVTGPIELDLIRRDGSQISVEIKAFLVKYGGEQEVVSIARDITPRKEMLKRMLQMERHIAAGNMVGVLSHGFKNLLAETAGHLDNLREGMAYFQGLLDIYRAMKETEKERLMRPLYSKISRPIDRLEESLGIMHENLKSMISFSRIGSEVKSVIGAKAQIAAICEAIKGYASQKNVELSYNLENVSQEDGIFIAEIGFQDIMRNLLINAIESFPPDFVPSFNKRRRVNVVALTTADERIVVKIFDNGMGIERERVNELLEGSTFTTKSGGSGLGLHAAKMWVESANGKLGIESLHEEDARAGGLSAGTVVSIDFPQQRFEKRVSSLPPPEVIPKVSRREAAAVEIMVIDDNLGVLSMAEERLKRLGFRVSSFLSPFGALRAYRKMESKPQIVLTDQTMTGMFGHQLVGRMAELDESGETHYIIYSGNPLPDNEKDPLREAMQKHVIRYVQKGGKLVELDLEIIRTAKKVIDRLPPEVLEQRAAIASRSTGFRNDPAFIFAGSIVHRFNNLLSRFMLDALRIDLTTGNKNEYAEGVGQLRTAFGLIREEVEALSAFAKLGRSLQGVSDLEETPLPKSLSRDPSERLKEAWENLPSEERYKLAVITRLCLEKGLWTYQEKMAKLLAKEELEGKDLDMIGTAGEELRGLLKAITLEDDKPELERIFFNYYSILQGL